MLTIRLIIFIGWVLSAEGTVALAAEHNSPNSVSQQQSIVRICIIDSATCSGISSARVVICGSDSSKLTGSEGICELPYEVGKSYELHIFHPEYWSVDTSLTEASKELDTVSVSMARVQNLPATKAIDPPDDFRDSSTESDSSYINFLIKSVAESLENARLKSWWKDYRIGWGNAQTAIDSGDAYFCGLTSGVSHHVPNVDDSTGLPIRWTKRCWMLDSMKAFAKGHNERTELYIKCEGLPSYSKKRWTSIILSPKAFFDSTSRVQMPSILVSDSGSLLTPDSTFRVELKTEVVSWSDQPVTQLRITNELTKVRVEDYLFGVREHGKVTVVFGPTGSKLLFLKTQEGYENYLVFDISRCELLNESELLYEVRD